MSNRKKTAFFLHVVMVALSGNVFLPLYGRHDKDAFPRGDIKSVKSFDRYLASRKHSYVVALFYTNDGSPLDTFIRMFYRLADSMRYRDGNVNFIGVNLERSNLSNLVGDLNLINPQIPTVILFKDGQPVARGRAQGFLNESELRQLIESAWSSEIDGMLAARAAIREQRALQMLYYAPYFYGYGYPYGYGYGYPYYGYGYPYGAGVSFGFNVGF